MKAKSTDKFEKQARQYEKQVKEYEKQAQQYAKQLVLRTHLYPKRPAPGKGLRLALFQCRDKVNSDTALLYNLNQLELAVKTAKEHDAHLISFPEVYLTGYSLDADEVKKWAQTVDSPAIKKVQAIAKKYGIGIILPYPEKGQEKGKVHYYDTIAVINDKGKLLENWRKTTVFGFEDRLDYRAGSAPYGVVKINEFPFGVLNCYEAEFIEHQRILALKGAKLIIVPNATYTSNRLPSGKTGHYADVAHILMTAYAFANHNFVAFSNHVGFEPVGKEGLRLFWGNSLIAGPDGNVIIEANHQQTTLLIADIIPEAYAPNHPSNANYLRDRRPELYHDLVKKTAEFDGTYAYPTYPQGEYAYPGLKEVTKKNPINK